MKIHLITLALFSILLTSCSDAVQQSAKGPFDDRIDSLMALMTLEEKLGQLNLPTSGDITTGLAQSNGIVTKIKEGKVGGLFNIRGVDKIRATQKIAVEESRLGIPLLFGSDVIHGYRTLFPIPLGLSCTWDMELIGQSARLAAQEATADGIMWTFSPMVDICRDPRWGRVSEGNGEDAYLASQIAKAMVTGYQGDDLSTPNTMMSCVKHFALYGAGEAGRDYNTTDMSRIRMYNEYLPPYKAAVDAGVGSVMASFNEIDGVPATGNKWLLTDLLRTEWGFNGFVVSDYTGVLEMVDHGMGDLQTVSALALSAGLDMDMVAEGLPATLAKSLEEGKITEAQINEACRRILEAKFKLGLFDDPYRYCNQQRSETEVFTPENRAKARSAAAQSLVLLKNEGKALPISKSAKIALVGPMASNVENMAGTWSVSGDFEKNISLMEGLKKAVANPSQITYAKGSNIYEDPALEAKVSIFGKPTYRDDRPESVLIEEAVKAAKKSDVILAAMGEAAESTGESSSMSNIELPENQRRLLKALLSTGKPVVLVLFTGRPLAIKWESENIPSILNVFFAGSEAGDAVADVLFGDVNPSGKLSITFPQNVGQVPIFYNHKNTGRPLPKDAWFQKFRSNYLDVSNDPLYPFGFGLSYSTFTYEPVKTSATELKGNQTLDISVEIKNESAFDGKEVVQLYIRDLVGSVTRPVKELKGFQKIEIKAGEVKTVSFKITPEDLKFYNYDLNYVWESGEFDIMIGPNSRDVQTVRVNWAK